MPSTLRKIISLVSIVPNKASLYRSNNTKFRRLAIAARMINSTTESFSYIMLQAKPHETSTKYQHVHIYLDFGCDMNLMGQTDC